MISLSGHLGGDLDADLPDVRQRWVESANTEVLLSHHVGESHGGREEDRVWRDRVSWRDVRGQYLRCGEYRQ